MRSKKKFAMVIKKKTKEKTVAGAQLSRVQAQFTGIVASILRYRRNPLMEFMAQNVLKL